ncbi:MAG: hypothetical protein V4696_07585 [Pseudomonadota bacterium]
MSGHLYKGSCAHGVPPFDRCAFCDTPPASFAADRDGGCPIGPDALSSGDASVNIARHGVAHTTAMNSASVTQIPVPTAIAPFGAG